MGKLQDIKAELIAGHPDTGAYNVDDALAAAEMSAVNRPANGGVDGMLKYCVENRSRTDNGTDTTATAIIGRLQAVANAAAGTDPMGTTTNVTQPHIHAAAMFLLVLQSPNLSTVDFVNTEVSAMLDLLGSGPGNAKVWKQADSDAIKALSQNQQSRATELNLGRVLTGHVTEARAL